jgi:hypothetical protein
MGSNEARKTMRFWIFSGIVAIAASQIPLYMKKKQQPGRNQTEREQRKKRPLWKTFLFGAAFLGMILWLFDFFM